MTFIYSQTDVAHIELRKRPSSFLEGGLFPFAERSRDMGAVTVIIIRCRFPVYQIQKSDDAILWMGEICHGRNACIQKGDGNGALVWAKDFLCGKEPLF